VAYRVKYSRGQGFTLGPIGFLIVANLIMLIATMFRPEFIRYLALNQTFFSTQPWTIITSMFVHNGIFHLLFNMFTLYFFGSFLIKLLGEKLFFIIYFVGGLTGGVLFLLLSAQNTWAVGASGAVFAIVGALVVLRPKIRVFIFPIPAPIPLWGAVIGFVVFSFLPSIAWQAHLGGLAFGLGSGYLFKRGRQIYF